MMERLQGGTVPDRSPGTGKNLRVRWFDGWEPALDEALTALPEMRDCPRDLYRALAQNRIAARKRYALVEDGGTPVAVIVLRRYHLHWEPVTMWLVPGALFPVAPGYLVPSLAALHTPVEIYWWRMSEPPPTAPEVRDLRKVPVFGTSLSADFEQFWKHSGNWPNVRHNRNLCRDFTLHVDTPGAAEHVVRKWAERWAVHNPHITDHVEDRILAAAYLTQQGRYHTFLLMDKGEAIAGASVFVHNQDIVAGVNYRDTRYDRHGAMARVNDYLFHWGAEKGYAFFDIGGGPEYKQKWAPLSGEYCHFTVCPGPHHLLRHTLQLWTKARARLTTRTKRQDRQGGRGKTPGQSQSTPRGASAS